MSRVERAVRWIGIALLVGALIFSWFASQGWRDVRRHASLNTHRGVADAVILHKKIEEGDPCGGELLTVRYVDSHAFPRVAKVNVQCVDSTRPGDSVTIAYDTRHPSYAELPDDNGNDVADEFHAAVFFATVMATAGTAIILFQRLHRRGHVVTGENAPQFTTRKSHKHESDLGEP